MTCVRKGQNSTCFDVREVQIIIWLSVGEDRVDIGGRKRQIIGIQIFGGRVSLWRAMEDTKAVDKQIFIEHIRVKFWLKLVNCVQNPVDLEVFKNKCARICEAS